jgi:hypothetical protein
MRFVASRNSASSAALGPGLIPSSRSAALSQFVRHDSLMPKSAAICFTVCPGPRLRAIRTTSSRNSLGNGFGTVHILPAAPLGTTDQMSPIRAADPIVFGQETYVGTFRPAVTDELGILLRPAEVDGVAQRICGDHVLA